MPWQKKPCLLLLFSICVAHLASGTSKTRTTVDPPVSTTSELSTGTSKTRTTVDPPVSTTSELSTVANSTNSTTSSVSKAENTFLPPTNAPVSDAAGVTSPSTGSTHNSTTAETHSAYNNTSNYTPSTTYTSNSSTTTHNYTDITTPLNGTHITGGSEVSKGLSDNPGLVAVICIFVSILCITFVVVIIKFCQKSEPEFHKLDEVPMNGLNEEAPFARYPPK